MLIRALQPDERELYREAYEWTKDVPEWLKRMSAIWSWGSFEDYYTQATAENQVNFGVFNNDLCALITLIERAKGIFEAELAAKRGADIQLVAEAVRAVGNALINAGQVECYIWVAKRNRPVLNLCEQVGFHKTGISLLKGQYKERCIEWLKLASNNEEWAAIERIDRLAA